MRPYTNFVLSLNVLLLGRQLAFAPVTQTNIINSAVVKKLNKNPAKVVTVPADWSPQTRLDCYAQMCDAIALGHTRSVGVCNFSLRQLQELVNYCIENQLPLPSVLQNEFHPFLHKQSVPLMEYCRANNIAFQAHSSLGGPPPKNKKSTNHSLLINDVVLQVAQQNNVTPGTLLFRWARFKGVTSVIAKSSKKSRIEENRTICDAKFKDDGGALDALDLGHTGSTCFTWTREADPDAY